MSMDAAKALVLISPLTEAERLEEECKRKKVYYHAYYLSHKENWKSTPERRAHANALSRAGRARIPKEQRGDARRAYVLAHPERVREWNRKGGAKYRAAHQEEISAKAKAKYAANPQAHRDRMRRWFESDPEKAKRIIRESAKRSRAANPERAREQSRKAGAKQRQIHGALMNQKVREYRVAHPEKVIERERENKRKWLAAHPQDWRIRKSRRRALKCASGGFHTAAGWIALCWASAWRCHYCGVNLKESSAAQEHKIPLSRGGSDNIENIALSCRSCNSRKGMMTDVEYFERLANESVIAVQV